MSCIDEITQNSAVGIRRNEKCSLTYIANYSTGTILAGKYSKWFELLNAVRGGFGSRRLERMLLSNEWRQVCAWEEKRPLQVPSATLSLHSMLHFAVHLLVGSGGPNLAAPRRQSTAFMGNYFRLFRGFSPKPNLGLREYSLIFFLSLSWNIMCVRSMCILLYGLEKSWRQVGRK